MSKFYTNVFAKKNYIHHFYIEDGKRKVKKVWFKPSLGIPSKTNTGWKDIYGEDVGILEFDSIIEMYAWRKQNIDYVNIYNNVMPQYQFISEEYIDNIEPDFTQFRVANIDIEVKSDEGFPQPEFAEQEVTAITVQDLYKNQFYVFGVGSYKPKEDNVKYSEFKNEYGLLNGFLEFFSKFRPDIITGWNTEIFDMPYLINRMKKILDPGKYLKLSPINEISAKRIGFSGEGYNIVGIAHLDFYVLYKKFKLEKQDSYKLDHITKFELEEGKVDYHTEYRDLSELYEKNYELYIDYNIKDVDLVGQLNTQLKYIELIITMAYMARVNFEDAFGSVKIWDIFVYNELKKSKVATSPNLHSIKSEFPGGYVAEPKPGMHEWLVVFDITSSYPNQIISSNLSPETIVNPSTLAPELMELRNTMKNIDGYVDLKELEKVRPLLEKHNVSMTANGEFFSKEKYGVFPQIVSRVFNNRKNYKKKANFLYNEIEELKDELRKIDPSNQLLKEK